MIPNPGAIKARVGRAVNPARVKVNPTPKVLVTDTVGKTLDKCKVSFNL